MKIKLLAFAALLVAVSAFGQATLTSTTLSAAIASTSDTCFNVTTATGFVAPNMAFVDGEAINIISPTETAATRVCGLRGASGTRATTHASGATIYVGPPNYFSTYDRSGSCTSTKEQVLPVVNTSNGTVWQCAVSLWTQASRGEVVTIANVGAAETGVTAVEYGSARDHITKLTFSGLTIGTGATANLGFGKLLYTFPAGAVVVKVAHMNIALTGSGTGCDADTPDGGIGTVIASGVVKVLGGTSTFEDILTGQTFNNLTGTAEIKTVGGQLMVIEAASAHTVHFNLADDWAGACTVTGTGTVTLEWSFII
jgi:hypothetical protein